tara:strand:- start:5845 stop:6396 length:552 start_codon:yes stop_codon:yes gene_type:complete
MGWQKLLRSEEYNYSSTLGMQSNLTSVGDAQGQIAQFANTGTNDLSSHIGKVVSWGIASGQTYGEWTLADASGSVASGRQLLGIVTSETTSLVPKVLLEGIIRLDGANFSSLGVAEADTPSHMGAPCWVNPQTLGGITHEQSDFNPGHQVRLCGYILNFDSTNATGDEYLNFYFKIDNMFVEL